jgi:ABC-type nitrate/sulfonate/bicarbonate transport system substrate-binding protein
MNPFYQALGGKARQPQQAQPQQMNPMQMIQQMQQYVMQQLQSRNITIPRGVTSPQDITNYLLQNGNIQQKDYQAVQQAAPQMVQQMMSKFGR